MTRTLPPRPSLEQLRNRAKDLLKAHRAGESGVCPVLRHLPQFQRARDETILAADVKLDDVQFALAREYGFESWPKLKSHVELVEQTRRRLGHWERFSGEDEAKLQMVLDDPEWAALVQREAELEPMSPEAAAIRERIASMEPCHTCYADNVQRVLTMIGSMQPGPIFDCGDADDQRRHAARRYREALAAWLEGEGDGDTAESREVAQRLGQRDPDKERLVRHLMHKLEDNGYHAYPWEEEDFAKPESRITHLEICSHYWEQSLDVVLREIGAGQRLADWHTANGFNACGDALNRAAQLNEILERADAWLGGRPADAGDLGGMLGRPTPEKTWLLQSLCKHIRTASHQGRILE